MAASEAPKPKPEAPVLTDASLENLSREVGDDLRFCMLLNVPTTRIIQCRTQSEANQWESSGVTFELLKEWKRQRVAAKDRDKVADIERALKDIGKSEVADVFVDRYRQNIDITNEAFVA